MSGSDWHRAEFPGGTDFIGHFKEMHVRLIPYFGERKAIWLAFKTQAVRLMRFAVFVYWQSKHGNATRYCRTKRWKKPNKVE